MKYPIRCVQNIDGCLGAKANQKLNQSSIEKKGGWSDMATNQAVQHRYRMGQVCVFTNRGVSGVRGNDGKHCEVVRLKPVEEWAQGEPEYVIHFLDENHGFGVRECELEPTIAKGDVS